MLGLCLCSDWKAKRTEVFMGPPETYGFPGHLIPLEPIGCHFPSGHCWEIAVEQQGLGQSVPLPETVSVAENMSPDPAARVSDSWHVSLLVTLHYRKLRIIGLCIIENKYGRHQQYGPEGCLALQKQGRCQESTRHVNCKSTTYWDQAWIVGDLTQI